MTTKKRSVGPYYQGLGGILLIGALGAFLLHISVGHDFDWTDGLIYGGFNLAALALLRPEFADKAFQILLAKLPFFKFTEKDIDTDK